MHDAADPKLNRIIVRAKGENGGSTVLKTSLYLTLKADPDTRSHVIDITRQSVSFSTGIPENRLNVSENEDETQTISLQGDSSMRWIAELEQPEPALAHKYDVKIVSESGTEMSWGMEYPMSAKFKIQFPKTLYSLGGV